MLIDETNYPFVTYNPTRLRENQQSVETVDQISYSPGKKGGQHGSWVVDAPSLPCRLHFFLPVPICIALSMKQSHSCIVHDLRLQALYTALTVRR
jgi:hypothetical protein